METLTLIPTEDSVVFPGMTATLALEVGDEERVFLVPRHGEEFASVGLEAGQRALLVRAHEARIACDIGGQDGGEPALSVLRSGAHGGSASKPQP